MPWSKRRSRSSKCFVSAAVRPGRKSVNTLKSLFSGLKRARGLSWCRGDHGGPPAQRVFEINGRDQIGDVSGRPMPCWQRTLSHAGLAA
jgi:hypothetical protein